jgi:hypothetical protein
MNDRLNNVQNSLRSFLLMSELEKGEPISQREISSRLNIALGLVKSYPRKRYAYLLTPKGFAEKSRLAYQHLSNFNKLYRVTREDSLALFTRLREQGIQEVSFCGLDDLTEIFLLSLQEAGLDLVTVMEVQNTGQKFFRWPVVKLEEGVKITSGPIILTALQRAEELKQRLLMLEVAAERIYSPALTFKEIQGRTGKNEKR